MTKKSVIKYLENYHKAYKSVCLRLPYRRYGITEKKIRGRDSEWEWLFQVKDLGL